MRWDLWLWALLLHGLEGALYSAAALFLDGTVTKTEGIIIVGGMLTGTVKFLYQHPAREITWAAVVAQQEKVAVKKAEVLVQEEKLAVMKEAAPIQNDCGKP